MELWAYVVCYFFHCIVLHDGNSSLSTYLSPRIGHQDCLKFPPPKTTLWWAFLKMFPCETVWECLWVDIQKYDCLVIKYRDIYLDQGLLEWSLHQSILSGKDVPILYQRLAMSIFLSFFFFVASLTNVMSHWLICISLLLSLDSFSYVC